MESENFSHEDTLLGYRDQSPCFALCDFGLPAFCMYHSCISSSAIELEILWNMRMVYTELCLTCSSFLAGGISS